MHELFKNNLFLSKISHIQFFLFISFYFNLFLILLALLSIIFWRISIVFFEGGGVWYYKTLCNFFSEKCQEDKKATHKTADDLFIFLMWWLYSPHPYIFLSANFLFSFHFLFCARFIVTFLCFVFCSVTLSTKTLECRL